MCDVDDDHHLPSMLFCIFLTRVHAVGNLPFFYILIETKEKKKNLEKHSQHSFTLLNSRTYDGGGGGGDKLICALKLYYTFCCAITITLVARAYFKLKEYKKNRCAIAK